jgi:nitrate/TMAO reductase-like tetraheme cytochrome c subunit
MARKAFVPLCAIAALLAFAGRAYALHPVPSALFTPAAGCGCHAALYEQWAPSMHAQALSDPLYQYKLAQANEASDGALGPFCNGCHTPIGVMAGEVIGTDITKASDVAREGVTCDFCHQVTGTAGPIGNTSIDITADAVKRAQLKDSVSPIHATEYSAFHETAEFCGNCHNVDHPVNGMPLEATYTEYKNGPYAKEGIVCQDCHMTPGPGVTKPNPGKAAGMGPSREHIYTMTFAGGNVALGDAVLAEERLKAAATLDLAMEDVVGAGSPVALKTTITNVGAGHYLPTGLTDVRQMWLEVTAKDASGKELLSERRDFGTVFKDDSGKFPAEIWEASGVQSDDRIPPRESTSNDYAFTMATGPVTVTAALYYRSASEEFAKAAGVDVPTTAMVTATKTVYASAEQKAEAVGEGGEGAEGGVGGVGPNWTWPVLAALAVIVAAVIVFVTRKKRAA